MAMKDWFQGASDPWKAPPDTLHDVIFTIEDERAPNPDSASNYLRPHLYRATIEDNETGHVFPGTVTFISRHILESCETYSASMFVLADNSPTSPGSTPVYRDFTHDHAPVPSPKAPESFKNIRGTIERGGINARDNSLYEYRVSLHRGTLHRPYCQENIRIYTNRRMTIGLTYRLDHLTLGSIREYHPDGITRVKDIAYYDNSDIGTVPECVESPRDLSAAAKLPPVKYSNIWILYPAHLTFHENAVRDGHLTAVVETADGGANHPDLTGRLVTVPCQALPAGWDSRTALIPVAPAMTSVALDSVQLFLRAAGSQAVGNRPFMDSLDALLGQNFLTAKKDLLERLRGFPGLLDELLLDRLRKQGKLAEGGFPIARVHLSSLTVGFAENGRVYGISATTAPPPPALISTGEIMELTRNASRSSRIRQDGKMGPQV